MLTTAAFCADYVPSTENPPEARRVVPAEKEKDYAMIGRFERWVVGDSGKPEFAELCTASLIADDLVLTAAHCLASGGKAHKAYGYIFKPGYDHGKAPEQSWIEGIAASGYPKERLFDMEEKDIPDYSASDWAVLRLKKPLGKTLGYLKFAAPALSFFKEHRTGIVGYATDFEDSEVLVEQEGCFILGDVQSYRPDSPFYRLGALPYIRDLQAIPATRATLLHNCTTTAGYSGAPLLYTDPATKERVIVAIQTSGPPSTDALDLPLGAAPLQSLVEAIKESSLVPVTQLNNQED